MLTTVHTASKTHSQQSSGGHSKQAVLCLCTHSATDTLFTPAQLIIIVKCKYCRYTDTIGTDKSVLNSEVSSLQGLLNTQTRHLRQAKVSCYGGVLISGVSL